MNRRDGARIPCCRSCRKNSTEYHSGQLEELDVEGILAFAERILPRAADLCVQASLDQRQRFQQLFFPDGIAFDGNRFIGTGATAPAFSYLREIRIGNEGLVDQTGVDRDLLNAMPGLTVLSRVSSREGGRNPRGRFSWPALRLA